MDEWDGDRWWSVKEVEEYLGIKRDTLNKWIDRKEIPAHKVGKLWKFRRDEVDAWVRSGGEDDRPNGRKDQITNS
jgi:excisionase family DNA binding protein